MGQFMGQGRDLEIILGQLRLLRRHRRLLLIEQYPNLRRDGRVGVSAV